MGNSVGFNWPLSGYKASQIICIPILISLPMRLLQILLSVILLCSLYIPASYGQSAAVDYLNRNIAEPPFSVFEPGHDYKGSTQNWSALQLSDGRMLFPNSNGLLIYDGDGFQTIGQDSFTPRDIIKTSDGDLYISGSGYFGELKADEHGQWQSENLFNKLPEVPGSQVAWQLVEHQGAIYLRFSNGYVRYAPSDSSATYTHFGEEGEKTLSGKLVSHNDRLFAVIDRQYLYEIKEDELEHLQALGDEPGSNVITLSDPHRSDENGAPKLLLNIGPRIVSFDTARDEYEVLEISDEFHSFIDQYRPYDSTLLSNGYLALGTITGGVMVVDENFDRVLHLDTDKGLPANTILSLYEDNQRGLWLMTGNGLVRIDFFYPYWKSVRNREIAGSVYQTIFHGDDLLVSTAEEIQRISPSGITEELVNGEKAPNSRRNTEVTMTDGSVRRIININQIEFAEITEGSVEQLSHRFPELSIIANLTSHEVYPETFFFSNQDGVFYGKLGKSPDGELTVSEIDLLFTESGSHRDLKVDEKGSLWINDHENGVIRLFSGEKDFSITENPQENKRQYFYSDNNDLPHVHDLAMRGEEMILLDADSTHYYSFETVLPQDELYAIDDLIRHTFDFPVPFLDNTVRYKDKIIYDIGEKMVALHDDGYLDSMPVFNAYGEPYRSSFSPTSSGDKLILPSNQGVISYRPEFEPYYITEPEYKPVITSLQVETDSLFWEGGLMTSDEPAEASFDYADNQFQFSFAPGIPIFPDQESRYQTRLLPAFPEWTEWSERSVREFTSLQPGDYTFEVRSKNSLGTTSEIEQFSFMVRTPWYRSTAAFILYVIGFAGLVYGSSRKISDYRNQQQLRKMKAEQAEELAKMERMRSRLFTNISHDLRTPLTLMAAPVQQMLIQDKLPVEVRKNLEVSLRNSERMRQLIEQISDLTRLESDKISVSVQPIDVANLTRILGASFQSLAHFHGIQLQVELTDEPVIIYADSDKLEKILTNLISNALKFTDNGGSVHVELRELPQDITLTIRDTGIGIPEQLRDKIFDPFVSSAKKHTDNKEGLGIGLSITREYVHLHSGKITVDSRQNEGTTFTVTIPKGSDHFREDEIYSHELATSDSQIALTTTSSEPADSRTDATKQVRTALLVEDNKDMAEYVLELLAAHKFDCKLAKNGKEALEVLERYQPDIIISDIMMPEMDGLELLYELKKSEQLRSIPVMFLSAKSDLEGRIESFRLGVNDYILKPFHTNELLVRVENLIEFSELRRAALIEDEELEGVQEDSSTEHTDEIILKIQNLVIEHIADSNFTLDQIAPEIAMSRSSMYRYIKKETGLPAGAFVKEIRLQHARRMIENKSYRTLKEVSLNVGFSNTSYFSRQYMERFGIKPFDAMNT